MAVPYGDGPATGGVGLDRALDAAIRTILFIYSRSQPKDKGSSGSGLNSSLEHREAR